MSLFSFVLALLAYLYFAGEANGCTVIKPSAPCSSKYVKFLLYRSSEKKFPKIVGANDLKRFSWDSNQKNHMLINGYGGFPTLLTWQSFKDALFYKFPDGNVFMVDYVKLAKIPCYYESVSNIKYVGKCLAEFLEKLGDANNGTLDIHILGASLGAHVPANAVPYMKKFHIRRITALDPAGPLFDSPNGGRALTLSPKSADFVDCIHTNGVAFGTKMPMGHVDFFVNNATIQPGCVPPLKKTLPGKLYAVLCSHLVYPTGIYEEELVHPDGFWARKCDGAFDFEKGECVSPTDIYHIVGEDVDLTIRGNYSLNTRAFPPFALGLPKRH